MSRLRAPYWMARHAVARATGPIRSEERLTFMVGYRSGEHPTILRKCQSDLEVWREVFIERDYDFAYEEVLPEIDVIIDVGANVGFAATYFQMRFPHARIVTVEPLAENVRLIRANADAIGASWGIEEGAIGAAAGRAECYASEYWNTASVVADIGEYRHSGPYRLEALLAPCKRTVPVLTVPQLLEKHEIDGVSIMKMDIEGAEVAVLMDGGSWLHRVGILIVELHTKYFDSEPVRRYLYAAGFEEKEHRGSCAVFINRGVPGCGY